MDAHGQVWESDGRGEWRLLGHTDMDWSRVRQAGARIGHRAIPILEAYDEVFREDYAGQVKQVVE